VPRAVRGDAGAADRHIHPEAEHRRRLIRRVACRCERMSSSMDTASCVATTHASGEVCADAQHAQGVHAGKMESKDHVAGKLA